MEFIKALIANNLLVVIIAVSILISAFGFYIGWFKVNVNYVKDGIDKLIKSLPEESIPSNESYEKIELVLKHHQYLRRSWDETRKRIIKLDNEQDGQKAIMFGSPRDLWSPIELLNKRFNYGLAESIPNMLVGIGLLLTFFFLTKALIEITPVFSQVNATSDEHINAISGLLSAAGGKFLTSLSGLLASILWTWGSKIELRKLSSSCDELIDKIGQLVTPNASEVLMLREVNWAKKKIDLSIDANSFSEEILLEAREQTGTFKRFETDLAVTLAGAITKSFTPQMEEMTKKLVMSIDGLSEKMGTMNQEALQTMLEDFSGMLKQTTESEMQQLQTTLSELATNLQGAGSAIGSGASGAAEAINMAGSQLVERVQQISDNLDTGASNLQSAAESIKIAMNDLDTTISDATEIGKAGAKFVSGALDRAGTTIDKLGTLSSGLEAATESLQQVSGTIANVVDNVEELSREQRAVVTAVKESAPDAMAAIERVTDILSESASQTLAVMDRTKQSMESTAAALDKTVASITGGISSYTEQVAQLHVKMDSHMATAVGSLTAIANQLQEAAEEIAENMSSARNQ